MVFASCVFLKLGEVFVYFLKDVKKPADFIEILKFKKHKFIEQYIQKSDPLYSETPRKFFYL